MIDNKLIVQDTGLAEKIVASGESDEIDGKYITSDNIERNGDGWIIVLWNSCIMN